MKENKEEKGLTGGVVVAGAGVGGDRGAGAIGRGGRVQRAVVVCRRNTQVVAVVLVVYLSFYQGENRVH